MQVIELSGGASLERGQGYGEAARERINSAVAVYTETLSHYGRMDWAGLTRASRDFLPAIEGYAPELVEEMKGVAQGAGVDFADILTLNCRSELMARAYASANECTSMAALPQQTAAAETLLAQNWDWMIGQADNQVCLKIPARDNIPALVTFTEAGQLAKLGMNSAGLALCVNALWTDRVRVGLPWLIMARKVLESATLTEAIGRCFLPDRAGSINFMIAHRGGEAVDLEMAAREQNMYWAQDGLLAHANHFLTPGEGFTDLRPKLDYWPSSYNRQRRMERLLRTKSGELSEGTIKEILTDHFDNPFSICAHPNPNKPKVEHMGTLLGLIMNLTARKITYCHGRPCTGEWVEMDLSSFLGNRP